LTHARTNFGLLRLLAALMVLVSHAFVLAGRPAEPLAASTGVATLGLIGVHVFFAISGHLVTISWLADPHVGRFVARRLLRILPALAVVVVLSVFVLGPLTTDRPFEAYFGDGATWRYLGGALTYPIRYTLPGVFAHNPIAGVVNGSLWTLPLEMLMYLGVVVLGVCGLVRRPGAILGLLAVACGLSLLAWRLGETHDPVVAEIDVRYLLAFAIAFLSGALMAVAGERIPRSRIVALLGLAACALLVHRPVLRAWLPLAVAYAVVVIGERGVEPLASVGERNDLSYGLYLWAYPMAQIVVAQGITNVALVGALSFAATVTCALASWRLVEAPALRLKPARPTPDVSPRPLAMPPRPRDVVATVLPPPRP
jgi:peptidoglycan/LPS O-acetylase OafA/YrhL